MVKYDLPEESEVEIIENKEMNKFMQQTPKFSIKKSSIAEPHNESLRKPAKFDSSIGVDIREMSSGKKITNFYINVQSCY